VRLVGPRDRTAQRVAGLALLAIALVAAQIRWTGSPELERLRSGWLELGDAWTAALDPDGFHPVRIDVTMGDAQRAQIERHVERSLALGAIPHSEDDWVKATVSVGPDVFDAKARLKGDLLDHIDDGISLRISLRGTGRALGLRTFNLQHPKTRRYLWEWAYMRHAEREDLLAPRHEFVNASLPGASRKPYLLLEHFSKELLERQRRREGIVVKFSEADYFAGGMQKRAALGEDVALRTGWRRAPIEVFGEGRIAGDSELSLQRTLALERFEAFRSGELGVHEVFDVERTARWLALTLFWGAHHGLHPNNTRVYYDPVLGRFEPIAFDGIAGPLVEAEYAEFSEGLADYVEGHFLSNPILSQQFVAEALRLTEPRSVEALLDELMPELETRAAFLMQDPTFQQMSARWTHFGWLYRNARWLRERIAEPADAKVSIRSDARGRATLEIRPRSGFALQWLAVELADGRVLPIGSDVAPLPFYLIPGQRPGQEPPRAAFSLPVELRAPKAIIVRVAGQPDWETARFEIAAAGELETPQPGPSALALVLREGRLEREDALASPPLPRGFAIEAKDGLRWVVAPPGEHRLHTDLWIPPGYAFAARPGARLLMDDGVAIVVEGPVSLIGSVEQPIEFAPLKNRWEGLVVIGGNRASEIEHVRFRGVSPSAGARGPRRAGWIQTGGVTFVDSELRIRDTEFEDFDTEDALNVVRGNISLSKVRFAHTASDAFDGDFVDGSIVGIDLEDIGGDGVDVSGSTIALSDVRARGVRDKAVSIGERSHVTVERLTATDGAFALVAKDDSEVTATDVKTEDIWIALAAYTKKPEFGPARIEVNGLTVEGRSFPFLVQTGSRATLDGRRLPTRSFDSEDLYARQ
jgi:hypothetical protein